MPPDAPNTATLTLHCKNWFVKYTDNTSIIPTCAVVDKLLDSARRRQLLIAALLNIFATGPGSLPIINREARKRRRPL